MNALKYFFFALVLQMIVSGCTKDKGKPAKPGPMPVAPVTNTTFTSPTTQPTNTTAPTNTTTPTNTTIPVPEDTCKTEIKYSTHISKIVANSCAIEGCHVASGYKDFATYDLLKAQIDVYTKENFLLRIKPGGGMPPSYSTGAKLTSCDVEKIEAWLKEGYPNN